jgi:hypothetical protein
MNIQDIKISAQRIADQTPFGVSHDELKNQVFHQFCPTEGPIIAELLAKATVMYYKKSKRGNPEQIEMLKKMGVQA